MKNYLGLFIVFALLFGFNFVSAQEEGVGATGEAEATLYESGAPNRDKPEPRLRPEIKQLRGKLQSGTIEEKAKEAREEMKAKMEKAKEAIEARREQLKEKNEALREKAKQKLEDLKSKIKDEKEKNRFEGRTGLIVRFDAQVEKIVKFQTRVNELTAKLEAKGLDVSGAKTHSSNSALKLEEAKAKIAEIHTILSVSINELSKTDKTKLQTLAKDTGVLLRNSYEELHLAAKSLKEVANLEAKIKTETTTGVGTETESN